MWQIFWVKIFFSSLCSHLHRFSHSLWKRHWKWKFEKFQWNFFCAWCKMWIYKWRNFGHQFAIIFEFYWNFHGAPQWLRRWPHLDYCSKGNFFLIRFKIEIFQETSFRLWKSILIALKKESTKKKQEFKLQDYFKQLLSLLKEMAGKKYL